jgi:DNA-binding Lrp family transcriptional regulator
MTETRENIQRSISPEHTKAQEKLSDKELGSLLSAVGNHEAKAITLILMSSGNVFDRGSLHGELIRAQGQNKGWVMAWSVPFQYCSYSLSPIGLVAKEILDQGSSTFGYAITEYGQQLGVPLAGLLLDFSEKHNVPLNQLFGGTNSSAKIIQKGEAEEIEVKKRSPSTTLAIIKSLLRASSFPLREIDIADKVGIDAKNVKKHLSRLSELGLVKFESSKVNKPYSLYGLSRNAPKTDPPIYKSFRSETHKVFEIIKNLGLQTFTASDIYNVLSQERKERVRKEYYVDLISSVLYFLNKHKYLELQKFHNKQQSAISMSESQRKILRELITTISKLQNKDSETLRKGLDFSKQIIVNPKRVSDLLIRAKEASGNANQASKEDTQKIILSIITANPGITNREIRELIKKQGRKLKDYSISQLSSLLAEKGSIRVVKEGVLSKFYTDNSNLAA